MYLQKDFGANRNINYNNYVIATSTNNDFNITDDTLAFVDKEVFNTEDTKVGNSGNINPYYNTLYSEEYVDPNNEAKNSNRKIIGKKIIRFESDGEYDSKTKKYYYDHKNYADISVTMPKHNKTATLNKLQKNLFAVGLANERQAMYKLIEPGYNATLEYKTEELNLVPNTTISVRKCYR